MPMVTKGEAIELLTKELKDRLGVDELLEVYNEVFPDDPYTAEEAPKDVTPLVEQLVDHLNSGLAVEEIVDLWGLIFSRHRDVWYDEEAERIHYTEDAEPVTAG